MKNAAVTELNLALVLTTAVIAGMFAIGCGGDPACADGACGPDPTDDAGTSGDENPISKEDGGNKSDGGDVSSSDSGSDTDTGGDSCVNFDPDEGTWYNDDPQNPVYYGEAANISLSPAGEKKCTVTLGGKVGVGAVFEGEDYPLVRQTSDRKATLTKEGVGLILKYETPAGTALYPFSRTKPN